ncbi:MAG: phosphoribosylaminoimidazolesuccinocarboxamide synthase, phosphoribosylaminoimidazole-succinocarboxamide synthase [Candidatus Peregrinibacteria bacterium GW2011_GWE2_39_6]|nr:MAG: phosphoribosylaminoimidazolesuccinocarboxamide synthase, phosphoribosylaminoimidazole-succinocarboxamide synthase [Candidatus Peregrinibacteria bacterium GW2011_GWF2_39_17]KKR24901.1 MAG: phosphoribosylaminoimidazolesuccinocarboxamide synthase, phosphoribosylaminoimidazole-succinocarboxamide synthase [Candidatus Peregrinibacteria bacterium GW2011_GWE2_39_6]HCW32299.1 phosphoribosylaminoimidazolesuccinocarboxamide synthase [Candidatus Peregrinibacteria bacterium]
MLTDDQIIAQLPYCLKGTDFAGLGEKYHGKVRDNYTKGKQRILIASDRLSAFDRIICTIPFKGQVLNQMAEFWFTQTKDICPNHVLDFPDPNIVVAKQCHPLAVEMVVRDYMTGTTSTSIWHHYQQGVRNFCGNDLPDGMKRDQKLDHSILTPSTKAEKGDHDESVTPELLLERGIITKKEWDYLADVSLRLFKRGQEIAAKQGIILVDTKYEFGKDENGDIVIIDEIHTPDSSRFWLSDTYQSRFEAGDAQDNLNKEFLRLWLSDHGYKGDGDVPVIPDEIRAETAKRYIDAYEKITGQVFQAEPCQDIESRIRTNLSSYFKY